jgi:hypothetical protein
MSAAVKPPRPLPSRSPTASASAWTDRQRSLCADGALSEAASRAAVAFEAAPSTTVGRGFGLPTTMRTVPPRSLGSRVLAPRAIQSAGAPYMRRVWRSSASGVPTACRNPSGCIRGQRSGSSSPSKVGARCVSSARRDLCGGRSVMSVPTATSVANWSNRPFAVVQDRSEGPKALEASADSADFGAHVNYPITSCGKWVSARSLGRLRDSA